MRVCVCIAHTYLNALIYYMQFEVNKTNMTPCGLFKDP